MLKTRKIDPSHLRGYKYSPQTGMIYRSRSRSSSKVAPCNAFNKMSGYRTLRLKKANYLQHRLAFVFMGEEIPEGMEVDHKNGIRHDNRWNNLRIATKSENQCNRKSHRDGRERYIDFFEARNQYRIRKFLKGELGHFGLFKTLEEAVKRRDDLIANNWQLNDSIKT